MKNLLIILLGLIGFSVNAKTPFQSTYKAFPSKEIVIRHATVLIGNGERMEDADVWMKDGKVYRVGRNLDVGNVSEIDAKGKWVTPGIIDVHSHLGVYPSPSTWATEDGNEMTNPITAEVWAEHSVWPQDPQFDLALAAGVTTIQILPGSGNLMGGRSVTVKNVPAVSVQEMKFPGAPYGLKMACGENPKRVYGKNKNRSPSTRMGNMAVDRAAWIKAEAYRKKWDDYTAKMAKGDEVTKPDRDLQLETLADVLRGKILVHNHCYRADEMMQMMDMAKEFGYKVTAFHHAVEAYKIADKLKENDVCAAMWADWWGFKLEAYDTVRENAAMVDKAGACTIIHSDSPTGIQFLPQETAKVMGAAARKGLDITPEHAIQWLTENPAKSLGVLDQTGTLEKGKMADLVVWDGNPFSVYTHAEQVFIDGALLYDRNNRAKQTRRDFMLGQE
ncbi:MAG: amidohydrolase [bacterium]